MANEKRLIDAKAFDLRVSKHKMDELFPNWKELSKEIQDMLCEHGRYLHTMLETQPTVDAVEVVRCKDCKYEKTCSILWESKEPKENGYCSLGERKDDGTA